MSTANGYTCGRCGEWVPYGLSHNCERPPLNLPSVWQQPLAPVVPHLLAFGPVLIEEMELDEGWREGDQSPQYKPTGKAWKISSVGWWSQAQAIQQQAREGG